VIQLVDLKAQYRTIKPDISDAIDRVLESGRLVLGPEVAEFEREFAAYTGTPYAVGLNSGTSALHLSLLALGIGPGDEVITVPFTFVATVAAIGYSGARPVFVDVDPVSYTMDPARLEAAIGPRTRAVIPVHLYGQPADMGGITEVARQHGLAVIEDACQAHGASYMGSPAGSIGDLACFSFYPGKNLGAYGEGGAITTWDLELVRKLRLLRDWGAEEKYSHVLKGYNYRLEELQAAILRVKLRHLHDWTEARRALARCYGELLGEAVGTPVEMPYGRHVYHVYSVRVDGRDSVRRSLQDAGIQTGVHYPVPVHLQPAWAELGYRRGDFPASERAADEVLSLPLYPELGRAGVTEVADRLLGTLNKWRIA
jgi:dTDP-4-amino-4,6-dideoxygalactose transaminase